jgi:hypothetical protein
MLRPLIAAVLVLAAGCGNKKKATGEQVDMSDATCQDADSCAADCERGQVAACALASTVYGLGYKVPPDPALSSRYRTRYLTLRERGCKQEHRPLCGDSAPKGTPPDWPAVQRRCQGGDLNSCLRCMVDGFGPTCSRVPGSAP